MKVKKVNVMKVTHEITKWLKMNSFTFSWKKHKQHITLDEFTIAELKQKKPACHYQIVSEPQSHFLTQQSFEVRRNPTLNCSPIQSLNRMSPAGGSPSLGVGFTFAFGAFLTPPLEPAPDQAVKGAQILHAIGQEGHGVQHQYFRRI